MSVRLLENVKVFGMLCSKLSATCPNYPFLCYILKGTFVLPLPDDFDEPLEDFQEYS